MRQLNYTTLLLGTDIPYQSAELVVHQPRLKQIGFLGDKDFFTGVFFLNFSKSSLDLQGNEQLKDKTDFELFIALLNDNAPNLAQTKVCAQLVLLLLFPQYKLQITKDTLLLIKGQEIHRIDKTNFEDFKEIISTIFCISQLQGDETHREYNPQGALASAIAEKIKKGRQKRQELKGESDQNVSVIGRYISVLTVGLQKDMNIFKQYTVYQLMDQYKRYTMKTEWDLYINSKMAGVSGIDEPQHWVGDMTGDMKKDRSDIKDEKAKMTKRGTFAW